MRMTIFDVKNILGRNERQDHLLDSIQKLDHFFSRQKPPIEVDPANLVLDLMEELTSDLSLIFEVPFSNWSVDTEINTTYDLTCQCSRMNRYCKYDIVMWKYGNEKEPDKATAVLPVGQWVEWLPEKN